MREILDEFARYLLLVEGKSERTVEAYLRDVEDFLKFAGKVEFRPEDVESWISSLSLSPASANRKLSSVRKFAKFLRRKGIKASAEGIGNVKVARKLPDVPSENTILDIIEGLKGDDFETLRDRAMLAVLWGAGLRVSELVGLRLRDINFSEGYMRVRGKGGKERIVPFSGAVESELSRYLGKRRKVARCDRVFVNAKGKPLTRQGVWFILKKYGFYPHQLRHAFATTLLRGGANLRAVQVLLGHKNLSTTTVYTKVAPEYLKNAVQLYHPHGRFRKPQNS